jgi:hypothetical protein
MIPREHNSDFHWTNWGTHILFSQKLGHSNSFQSINKLKRPQFMMLLRKWKVMKTGQHATPDIFSGSQCPVNETRNRPSKPRGSIGENLTWCLQRYLVLGYQRSWKHLFLNINALALQIIPREHNFDLISITGREKFSEQVLNVPICPERRFLVVGITSPRGS